MFMSEILLISIPLSRLETLIDRRLDNWADKKLKQLLRDKEIVDTSTSSEPAAAGQILPGKSTRRKVPT